MHFVYIDDSKDWQLACFSALLLPADRWADCLDWLTGLRRDIRDSDGVHIRKEIHATDWLAGRGNVGTRILNKQRRAALFDFLLSGLALMPALQLINATAPLTKEELLFERLLNRINVNMRKAGSNAVIFSDEGKNYDSMLRRMRKHNFIASRFGLHPVLLTPT